MPQPYHNAVITDAGLSLLNKAQTGEAAVRFTRMVTGDGIYAADEKTPSALQKRTGLKSEKNSFPLSSMEATSDGGVKLAALLTNQNPATGEALVTDGYYINEIGLYAEEKDKGSNTEVLYSIAVAMVENGEYMPPYNGGVPVEIVQEYHAAISNSDNVSIHLTGTGAAMLAENAEKRFQEILEKIPPVDSELDTESENLVQNKAIARKIAELVSQLSTAWDDQKRYIDTRIADLINGAPETLDTLKEVADAIQENESIMDALNAAIGGKVDKVAGKGLSTNDFTTEEKNKLAGIPTVNNAKLTIQRNGTQVQTFTANQGTNVVANILVPTKISELEDDAGFGSSSITVDTEMSETSTNPVQNKVITAYINKLRGSTLHGFEINQAESDPDSMISYIEDSVGRTPAYMDYANDRFDYGGWEHEWFIRDLKPCMLNYDGTVAYELDPNDYTKKKGGTASDISDDSFPGNAMVGFPKVYWKISKISDDVARIRFCDKNMDGTFHCWSHLDANGNEIPYCYMPIYNGSVVNGKLRSLSGKSPVVSLTAQQEINYAEANNLTNDAIWYTEVFSDRTLINLLLLLVGKSTNTQETFGGGKCENSAFASAGAMNGKGLFYGAEGIANGVKVFGMEHYWGNLWRRIAGWVYENRTQKLKLTQGIYDGSSVREYNLDGAGYIEIPDSSLPSTTGYISKMIFSSFGLIPKESNGSSSTFYCDAVGIDNNTPISYAIFGGAVGWALACGALNSRTMYSPENIRNDVNASISCKPLASTGGGKS